MVDAGSESDADLSRCSARRDEEAAEGESRVVVDARTTGSGDTRRFAVVHGVRGVALFSAQHVAVVVLRPH